MVIIHVNFSGYDKLSIIIMVPELLNIESGLVAICIILIGTYYTNTFWLYMGGDLVNGPDPHHFMLD